MDEISCRFSAYSRSHTHALQPQHGWPSPTRSIKEKMNTKLSGIAMLVATVFVCAAGQASASS
jgi:hypothetical protein